MCSTTDDVVLLALLLCSPDEDKMSEVSFVELKSKESNRPSARVFSILFSSDSSAAGRDSQRKRD